MKHEDTKKVTFWQRLRYKFVQWWLFTFCNKTIWKGEIGAFRYCFRKYWLDIRSISPNHWNLRIGANNYPYGLLLTVVRDMQNEILANGGANLKDYEMVFSFFSDNIYQTTEFIFSDDKFCSALSKEIVWAMKRVLKKAENEAKTATKEELDADQVFMEQSVKRGAMNRSERRRASREERKAMREEIKKSKNDLHND